MNKVHRVIYNHALQAWVAVSELTKARKKHSEKAASTLSVLAVGVASLLCSPAAKGVPDPQLKIKNEGIGTNYVVSTNGGYTFLSQEKASPINSILLSQDGVGTPYIKGKYLNQFVGSVVVGNEAGGGYDTSVENTITFDGVLSNMAWRDAIEHANIAYVKPDNPNWTSNYDKTKDDFVRSNNIIIGRKATSYATNSLVIGAYARTMRAESVVIGGHATAGFVYQKSDGTYAVSGDNSIAIGYLARTNSSEAIVIGTNALAWNTGENTNLQYMHLGTQLGLTAETLLNIGQNTNNSLPTTKNDNLALRSIAIGNNAFSTAENTVTIGQDAQSLGNLSVAVGRLSAAKAKGIAIGANTMAIGKSSIAIGNDDIDSDKYRDIFPFSDIETLFAPAWTSTDGLTVMSKANYYDVYGTQARLIYSPNMAVGDGAIALGSRSVSRGTSATSIGALSFALGEFSTAMGIRSYVAENANSGIAAGDRSRVFSPYGIAVGNLTEASSKGTVSYGYLSHAVAPNSTAIGNQVLSGASIDPEASQKLRTAYVQLNESQDNAQRETAATNLDKSLQTFFNTPDLIIQDEKIYLQTLDRNNLTPINQVKRSKAPQIVGPGGIKVDLSSMVAIGSSSLALGQNALSVGHGAFANSLNSISFGTFSSVGMLDGTQDPATNQQLAANNSVAFGVASYAIGRDSIVAGTHARSRGHRSVLIGTNTSISHLADDALVIGYNSNIGKRSSGAIVLGNNVKVSDDVKAGLSIGVNTSIGYTTIANTDSTPIPSGGTTVVPGTNRDALGLTDIELTTQATSDNPIYNALALGNDAKVTRFDNWQTTQYTGKNAIAIGNRAHAYLENSVALGVNSRTDYKKDWLLAKPWTPKDTVLQVNSATTGVISIGAQTLERRIVNLAPGALDTDAVNVAQLRATSERLQNLALVQKDKSLHFVSVEHTNPNGEAGKLNKFVDALENYHNYLEYKTLLVSVAARQKILGETMEQSKVDALRDKMQALDTKFADAHFDQAAQALTDVENKINTLANDLGSKPTEAQRQEVYDKFLASFDQAQSQAQNAPVMGYTKESLDAELAKVNYLNGLAQGTDSIAIGWKAKTNATLTTVNGVESVQSDSKHSVAIGNETNISGNHSVAVGSHQTISGKNNIALGSDNAISAQNSTTVGTGNRIVEAGVIALGSHNVVNSTRGATVTDPADIVILGSNVNLTSNALTEHGVVLGSGSTITADNSAQSTGTTLGKSQGTAAQLNMSDTQTIPGTYGIVSVGSPDHERRIQNVAKGLIGDDSHDLINGSQLFELSSGGFSYQGNYTNAENTAPTKLGVAPMGTLKLLGKDALTDAEKAGFVTDNLYTVTDGTDHSITVLMKKAPAFDNITVGGVTMTGSTDTFKTLTVNDKKITGVASAITNFDDLNTANNATLNSALTVGDLKQVAQQGVTVKGTTGQFSRSLGQTIKIGAEAADATSTTTAPGNLSVTSEPNNKTIKLTLNNTLQNLDTIKGGENSSQLGFTQNGVSVTQGGHTVNLNVNDQGLALDQNGAVALTGLASVDSYDALMGKMADKSKNADETRVLTVGDLRQFSNQGLTFRDSTTDTTAPKSLMGSKVSVKGDATTAPANTAADNVYVDAKTQGTDRILTVGLSNELKGLTSISHGDDKAKLNFVDSGISLSKNGKPNVTITAAGTTSAPELDLHNAKLTGVASGIGDVDAWLANQTPDTSKVVNAGDVINVAKKGFTYTTDVTDESVTQPFGGSLSMKGGTTNFTGTTDGQNIKVSADGTAGLQVQLASNLSNIESLGRGDASQPNVTLNTDGSIDLGPNKSVKLTAGDKTLTLNNKVIDGVKSALTGDATTPLKDRITNANKHAVATLGDLKGINADGLLFKANSGDNTQKTDLSGTMQLKGANQNVTVSATGEGNRTLTMATASDLTGINTIQKGTNGPALHLVDKGIGLNGTKDAPHVTLTAGGTTNAPELNLNGAQLTNVGSHTPDVMKGTEHGHDVATLGDIQGLAHHAWTVKGDRGTDIAASLGDTMKIVGDGTVTGTTAANNVVVTSQVGAQDTDPKATLTIKLADELKGITKVANGTNEVNFNDNGEVGFKTGDHTVTMKAGDESLTLGNGKTTDDKTVALDNVANAITGGFDNIKNAQNLDQAITAGDLKLLNNAGITFKGNTNPDPDDHAVSKMGTTVNLTGTNGISTVAADTTTDGVTTRTMTVKLARDLDHVTSVAHEDGSSVTFGDNHTTSFASNGKAGVSMQTGAQGLTLGQGANATTPVALSGLKSGLGDGTLADLNDKTTGLDTALTAGDLKKVLNAQYTVETNQAGDDGKVALPLNGTLKVLAGAGTPGTFESTNLSTYTDGTDTIRVAMKKNPTFTNVKLGDHHTVIAGSGDTLTLGDGTNPVELTNVKGATANDSAVTVKDLKDKAKDITDKVKKPPFKVTPDNTPGGQSNTDNTPASSRLQALRSGVAGPVVYTDADGKRIVVGADGKYYDYEQAKGKVQLFDEKTNTYDWYALPTKDGESLTKVEPAPSIEAKTPAQLTLVNSNGKVNDAFGLSNVKSVLGDATDNAYTPAAALTVEQAKKLISQGDAGKTALLALSGAQLERAATLGDLQALALTGFDFTGNEATPELHQAMGSTLLVTGDDNVTVTTNDAEKTVKVELNKALTGLTSIENTTTGGKLGFAPGAVTVNKGSASVTITPSNGQLALSGQTVDGSNAVNVGNIAYDMKSAPDTSAVTKKPFDEAFKEITNVIGGGGNTPTPDDKTPGGKDQTPDDLNGQINALRMGTAGPVVYTDADGKRIVVGVDGQYYNYDEAKDLVQTETVGADGTKSYQWFKKSDLATDPSKAVAQKEPAKAEAKQLTLVNIDGSVDNLTTLSNVKSGLGVAVHPTTPVDAEKQKAALADAQTTAKDRVNGTDKKVGLKNLPSTMMHQAATLGDLQDVALTGFEFVGDTPNTPFTTMLGQTVSIKGAGGDTLTSSAVDNIKSSIDGNAMKLQLRSDVKNLASVKGADTDGKITFENNDGIGIEGKDNAKVVLTPSETTNADGTKSPTLTLTDGKGGKVTISGVTSSPDPKGSDAVTVGDLNKTIQTLTDSISRGKDGRHGLDGKPGPHGQDSLGNESILNQVMALRQGTAGTVVYTDAEGNRLVYGPDGQYHNAKDVDGKVFVDGKWYNEADAKKPAAERDGLALTGDKVPANVTPAKLAAVNFDGSTTAPYALNNVQAALPAPTGTEPTNGASQAALGLTDKHQAVTAGDLKRVAQDGFTFTADSGDTLHQVLGSTLAIQGSRSANAAEDVNTKASTPNMIHVAPSTTGLEIQLNKALTGLTSISGTPDNNGKTGKVEFVDNGIKIGGTDRDDVTISLNGTPGTDDGQGKKTEAKPGLNLGDKPLSGVAGAESTDGADTVINRGNLDEVKSAGLTFEGNNANGKPETQAKVAMGASTAFQGETLNKTYDKAPLESETAADNIAVTVAGKKDSTPATLTLKLAKDLRNLESLSGGKDNAHGITLNQGGLGVTTTVPGQAGAPATTSTVVFKPTGDNNGVTLSDGHDNPVRLDRVTTRPNEGSDLVNVETLNKKVNDLKNLIDGKGPTVEGKPETIPGPRGKDGLDGKLIDTVNGLRQGLGGTVVYTDAEGNRLVQGQDGEYYAPGAIDGKTFIDGKWYTNEEAKKPEGERQPIKEAEAPKPAENVILSLVNANQDEDTKAPYKLMNVKSGLGLEGDKPATDEQVAAALAILHSDNVKTDQVATAADLQALAKAGITVTTNKDEGVTTVKSMHLPLTGTLPVVGNPAAQYSAEQYDASNLATTLEDGVVRIGFKKAPTFAGLDLGGTENNPAVSVRPNANGDTLTFTKPGDNNTKVVIEGIKADKDDPNALITKKQFDDKVNEITHNLTVPTPPNKAQNGPAGKDGLNGKSLGEMVEGLLNGTAGNVVYTTPSDKGTQRVVKVGDNFYTADSVKDLVNDNGTWKEKDAKGELVAVANDKLPQPIAADTVNLSLVNKDGEVTQPVTLGNLASALPDGDILSSLRDAKEPLPTDRAATAEDLKRIAKAGFSFKGNNPDTTIARALGDTVNVVGAAPMKSAADNLNVTADAKTKTLTVQLAKDLKNLDGMGGTEGQGHISFKPNNTIGIDGADGNTITMQPTVEDNKPVLKLGGTVDDKTPSQDVQIKNISDGTDPHDAVTKKTLDSIKDALQETEVKTPVKGQDGLDGQNIATKTVSLINGGAGPVVYTDKDGKRQPFVRVNGELYDAKKIDGKTLIDNKWYNVADIGPDGKPKAQAQAVPIDPVDTTNSSYLLSLVNGNNGLTTQPVTLTNVLGVLDTDGAVIDGTPDHAAINVGDLKKVMNQGIEFAGNEGSGTVALGKTVDIVGHTFTDEAPFNADDYSAKNLVTTFQDKAIQVQFKTTPAFSTVKVGDTVIKNVDGKLVTETQSGENTPVTQKLITKNDLTNQFYFYVQADDGSKQKVFLRDVTQTTDRDSVIFGRGVYTESYTGNVSEKDGVKNVTIGMKDHYFPINTFHKDNDASKPVENYALNNPQEPRNSVAIDNVKTIDIKELFDPKNNTGLGDDLVNVQTLKDLIGKDAFTKDKDGNPILNIGETGMNNISDAIASVTHPNEFKVLEIGPDGDKIHLTTTKDDKAGGSKLDLTGTDNKAPVVISGVADGKKPGDMANVNVLNRFMAQEEGELRRRASASTAAAMATANLPETYRPGQRGIAIAGATYEGEQAVAIGMSAMADNGRWAVRGSLTTNRITTGANVGISFFW